jgi:hypothetical protein
MDDTRPSFKEKAAVSGEILSGRMSEERLEDFTRRPFIAEPAHAQTAPT